MRHACRYFNPHSSFRFSYATLLCFSGIPDKIVWGILIQLFLAGRVSKVVGRSNSNCTQSSKRQYRASSHCSCKTCNKWKDSSVNCFLAMGSVIEKSQPEMLKKRVSLAHFSWWRSMKSKDQNWNATIQPFWSPRLCFEEISFYTMQILYNFWAG